MIQPVSVGRAVNVVRVALLYSTTRRHSNIDWSYTTRLPKKSEIRNRTRNTPNKIFAIPAAAPAILEKPSNAATSAMIKKKIDQDNMWTSFPGTIAFQKEGINS